MAAYLRLLLKNRLAAFRPGSHGKEKRSKLVGILKVVGLSVLVLYLYGLIVFLEFMLFRLLDGIGQGQAMLGLVFAASTILYLIMGFFHINGELFFGKDTSFLAALPISSRSILTGKMLMVLVENALESILICAPVVVLYGISSSAGAAYYIKCLLTMVLLPVIPLTVGMVLSFLLIRISGLWKRREGMTTIFALLLFVGIMVGEMFLMNVDEAEMTQWLLSLLVGQGSLASIVVDKLPWIKWALDGIMAAGIGGWLKIGLFALVSIGAAALAIWLLGGCYMKLAVRQAEAIGRANRSTKRSLFKEGERSPGLALLWQEIRDVITVPVYATNCLIGMLVVPIMMVSMTVAGGEGFSFAELGDVLNRVPRGIYLTALTGIFALLGMMGQAPCTAVSREGKCHELRKTYPVGGHVQLMAKVHMGVAFHMAGAVLMVIIACALLPAFWKENIIAMLCAVPVAYLFSLSAVLLDALHPRLDWKTETEAVKQNMNAMLSMLLSVVLAALLVGAYILLMKWQLGWYGSLAVVLALVIVLDLLLAKWLCTGGTKSYYAH